MNFGACNRRHMLRSKLEGEKVVPKSRGGTGGEFTGGSVGPNNDR